MKKHAVIILLSVLSLAAYPASGFSPPDSLKRARYFPLADSARAAKKWHKWLPQFDFRANDTVLSLGCGIAWREFELSLLTDRLTFYLEDIDSVSLNRGNLNRYQKELAGKRKYPASNTFRIIYGTTGSIPVQNGFANKVTIMNAYHHFDNKDGMLREIHRVLKSDGKLIITDHVSSGESRQSDYGCDRVYFLLSEKDLVAQIVRAGFKLLSVSGMGKKTRLFVFGKS